MKQSHQLNIMGWAEKCKKKKCEIIIIRKDYFFTSGVPPSELPSMCKGFTNCVTLVFLGILLILTLKR